MRVSEEEELASLDIPELGLPGYSKEVFRPVPVPDGGPGPALGGLQPQPSPGS
jgi:hypothetical protein